MVAGESVETLRPMGLLGHWRRQRRMMVCSVAPSDERLLVCMARLRLRLRLLVRQMKKALHERVLVRLSFCFFLRVGQ